MHFHLVNVHDPASLSIPRHQRRRRLHRSRCGPGGQRGRLEGHGANVPGHGNGVIMTLDVPTIIRQGDPPGPNRSTRVTHPLDAAMAELSLPRAVRGRAGMGTFWHCHILEDEEHDMMRSLAVI